MLLYIKQVTNPSGVIFRNLVDLKICTCTHGWWDLLTQMLQDSPKLRFLTLTNVCSLFLYCKYAFDRDDN